MPLLVGTTCCCDGISSLRGVQTPCSKPGVSAKKHANTSSPDEHQPVQPPQQHDLTAPPILEDGNNNAGPDGSLFAVLVLDNGFVPLLVFTKIITAWNS